MDVVDVSGAGSRATRGGARDQVAAADKGELLLLLRACAVALSEEV